MQRAKSNETPKNYFGLFSPQSCWMGATVLSKTVLLLDLASIAEAYSVLYNRRILQPYMQILGRVLVYCFGALEWSTSNPPSCRNLALWSGCPDASLVVVLLCVRANASCDVINMIRVQMGKNGGERKERT